MEESYSTKSLSEDLERDFLKNNNQVISFGGGNGVWLVTIKGSFDIFKEDLEKYRKTRIYMHFGYVTLISNHELGRVMISLLGVY